MDKPGIIKRLIHTYPDAISLDEYGYVNLEQTAYNFAVNFINDFDDGYMKSTFGIIFDDAEDLANYIVVHMDNIQSVCQDFINGNYIPDYPKPLITSCK